jgi:hypothetical protein
VDLDAYSLVTDEALSFLVEALASTKAPSALRTFMGAATGPIDALGRASKLLTAAGRKLGKQAGLAQEEEEDEGMFDSDARNLVEVARRYEQPPVYSAEERQRLDDALAYFNAPTPAMKPHRANTKLYQAEFDAVKGIGRGSWELRVPATRIIAMMMCHAPQYTAFDERGNTRGGLTVGERPNDHHMVARMYVPMPYPLQDREIVTITHWEKLSESEFLLAQSSGDHDCFPRSPEMVRVIMKRVLKFTVLSPTLTKVEIKAQIILGGRITPRINNLIVRPLMANTPVSSFRFFLFTRPADGYDEGDATELGRFLMLKLYQHRDNEHVLREEVSAASST